MEVEGADDGKAQKGDLEEADGEHEFGQAVEALEFHDREEGQVEDPGGEVGVAGDLVIWCQWRR